MVFLKIISVVNIQKLCMLLYEAGVYLYLSNLMSIRDILFLSVKHPVTHSRLQILTV
jgi:hypothetical protein